MTRILTLLAALLIALAAYLMFRDHTNDQAKPVSVPVENKAHEVTSSTTNESDFHTWNEFTAENGSFKVLLPAKPQYAADMVMDPKTLETRKYETYALADNDGLGYIINVISMPAALEADEGALKTAVTDMLERNKENKLKNMKMGTLHGKPALDFSLDNKDILIVGKVLANDNKIYILSMIGKEDAFDQKNFDFFVNSFQLIEQKKG